MCVPTSLCKYYQNKAVRGAVDSLIDVLDGNNTPEVSWAEARNYNKALLSAAQVRGDFIEFLFKIWEESFGETNPGRLKGEFFEWKHSKPAKIWTSGELTRTYYRSGNPDNGGPSDVLGVWMDEKDRLRLTVNRYDEEEDALDLGEVDCPEGWKVENCDGVDYMTNEGSDIVELCRGGVSEMDAVRQRMAEEARRMVKYLWKNPPQ